ncbi:hypothetical protein BH11MYX1_BH11MYX1_14540 [soil metagenome]
MAQSETSARYHPARQARQLGDTPPARAFAAIAQHAVAVWPAFEAVVDKKTLGIGLGREIGKLFSTTRYLVFDRWMDTQRSYRATLLGLQHGLDCGRLLRRAADHMNDRALVTWCDDVLSKRADLVGHAEQQLAWFADHPEVAVRSISTT